MRQYFEAKRQYRHALLFFRMGDFYEMFYEDALVASRALDLTLTSRSKDASGTAVPMCGVPFHAADGYITRLVKKGYRVAICEQIENPKTAKGVVKRDVVRVVSPGTLTDSGYLDAKEPAFLMAIVATAPSLPAAAAAPVRPSDYGVAIVDLSTGEFDVAEYGGPEGLAALRSEIAVLRPREIVVASGYDVAAAIPEIAQMMVPITEIDGWHFELESARQTLVDQLRVQSLEGFGLERRQAAICAGGRAGAAPARHAEGRPGPRPQHSPAPVRRRPADRSDHAQAPRDRAGDGRRPQRLAARGDRSHDHADGLPAAAHLAAPPADGARADSRSPRRRRRAGGQDDRARQGPRNAEVDSGPRAADFAHRPVDRRAARPDGAVAIARPRCRGWRCCCRNARRRCCAA